MALLATGLPVDCQRRVCALGGGPFEAYLRAKGIAVEVHRATVPPRPSAGCGHVAKHHRLCGQMWCIPGAGCPRWWPDPCAACRGALIDGTIRTGALQPGHLWLKRIGMACATTVVANTHAGVQAWGVDPAKARVVYNGFDWSRLATDGTARARERAGSGPGEAIHRRDDRQDGARRGTTVSSSPQLASSRASSVRAGSFSSATDRSASSSWPRPPT